MSDPRNGHESLVLPDLNKNFRTDPAHIPRIQERSSRDRVEPVELSKPILERMIGRSSGMVKDQPNLSFVAFYPEMDSALLVVSQNGECLVVPTHEDGSSKFLEQLSLLPKLLKIPDIGNSLSSHEALELFQRFQPTDVCTKSKELVPRTEEDTARTNPSNQEASAPGQGLQEATIVSSTLEQHHQEEEEAQTDVSVEFKEVVAGAAEDTAKTSLSNQEAPEPSQGLQLDAIDSNQEAPEPSQGLQLDAIDSILRHQKEAEVDLLWKQLEALAKAVEENGRKEDSNGQLSGDELKHGSMDSHPQLHIQTVRTSLSSQEASELFQRLQLAAIDSSILGHHQDAQISALWNALINELFKARAIKDQMKLVTHAADFADYGGKQLVPAYLQEERRLQQKITAVLENLGRFVLSDQDCMKVVTHVAGFAGSGGKQLVSAYLQEKQLAKKITAVLVQLEKPGQFVLSDQDRMKLVTHAADFAGSGGKQLVPAYLQGEQLAKKITAVLDNSGRVLLSDQNGMKLVTYVAGFTGYGGKQLVSAYLQREQLAKKIAAVHVQLEKSGQFVLSDQGSLAQPCETEKAKEEQKKEFSECDARIRQTVLNWLMLNGMRNLKRFHEYYCDTLGGNYTCEDQSSIVQQSRCMGFLQRAYQILNKEQSNKNIINVCDIVPKMLVDNCVQLKEKFVQQSIDRLAVDRKYTEAYNAVRESYGNIRRNVERWRDAVLHSVVPWFKEGAYNSNVRKLMSRGLARFGKGGNGELVEAFQSGERLVIKQTLLRESEWSIVTQMDHPNVMPWLALICGDRSDTKPGQIVSYQVMPKMTEDLSAAIRKMGGSIHHYILQLQEAEEPNSVLSEKADLVRQRGAEILRGTLQGLDYMHRQNLVHRDIKASNILLKRPVDCPHEAVHTCTCQERWEVRVADFDSVIHLSVARDRAQRRKQLKVGNTGTSGYRAPEVFFESCTSDIDAKDYYSPASDIWSFGAVCLHLAMGFCCPRHQYQVGLIMLARHNLVNIPAEEAQEKVDRTVGMYHIRQGFTGEKWQNMINFTARPLEVDWSKRPSAETLLKDPFVKPATTLHSSQTDTSNMNEKNEGLISYRPPTSPPKIPSVQDSPKKKSISPQGPTRSPEAEHK